MKRMAYQARAERLEALMGKRLDATKHKLHIYVEKYKALSPLEKIGHGFAAVTDEKGNKITDIDKVSKGDRLTLTMRQGTIETTAERIEKR